MKYELFRFNDFIYLSDKGKILVLDSKRNIKEIKNIKNINKLEFPYVELDSKNIKKISLITLKTHTITRDLLEKLISEVKNSGKN